MLAASDTDADEEGSPPQTSGSSAYKYVCTLEAHLRNKDTSTVSEVPIVYSHF